MTDYERFGKAVAKVRKLRGLSLADLAERLGVHPADVALLEAGHRQGITFRSVAEALELPDEVLALLALDTSKLDGFERMLTERLADLALELIGPLEVSA